MLCNPTNVSPQVISPELWRGLPAADRQQLSTLLPISAQSSEEEINAQAEQIIEKHVGATEAHFFGTPIEHFHEALLAGEFEAEAVLAAEQAEAQRRIDWVDKQREHHNAMVHQLHYIKRTWTPPPPQLAKLPKGSGRGKSDEALMYSKASGGLVRRSKTGGVGVPLGRPCLGDSRAGSTAGGVIESQGSTGGAGGSRGTPMFPKSAGVPIGTPLCPTGVHNAAGTSGGGGGGGGSRPGASQGGARSGGAMPPLMGGFPPRRAAGGEEDDEMLGELSDEDDEMLDELEGTAGGAGLPVAPPLKRPRPTEQPLGGYGYPGALAGGAEADEGGGVSGGVNFFSLVRDAMASVPQALAPAEYIRKQVAIQAQAAGLMARLPKGTMLAAYIRSVLIFMTTPAHCHAARTVKASGVAEGGAPAAAPTAPPPAPLLLFDDPTQSYRWVGSPEASTDEALRRLEALHHENFLAQHGGITGTARGLGLAPLKAPKAALTLPPGSAEQLARLHEEEARRYAQPDLAFVYTLRDGSTATVAPVGRKAGGKAREHFLLQPERPAAATLLALVRDAVARLPGGEGSRTDVCELLKESQFITDGANDAQISTVASGALDRLHYEADPCCRYDSERKLWVYLHGDRSVASFAKSPTPTSG